MPATNAPGFPFALPGAIFQEPYKQGAEATFSTGGRLDLGDLGGAKKGKSVKTLMDKGISDL